MRLTALAAAGALTLGPAACAPASAPTTDAGVLGEVHQGQYHLGPVDFAETQWHNACAPEGGYRAELRGPTGLFGEYLAGVSTELSQGGAVCDACVLISTEAGRAVVARVVTYGTSNAPGDLDVSPSVYQALSVGEYPRAMRWQLAVCPPAGPLRYELQAAANEDWTSLWVRTPAVPVTKVEVRSAHHATFTALRREADGTVNDDTGFGAGAFELRVTGLDGATVTDTFPSLSPGALLTSSHQLE
jgi:hypothetical protein